MKIFMASGIKQFRFYKANKVYHFFKQNPFIPPLLNPENVNNIPCRKSTFTS